MAHSAGVYSHAAHWQRAPGRHDAHFQYGDRHGTGGTGQKVQARAVDDRKNGRESLPYRPHRQRRPQGAVRLKYGPSISRIRALTVETAITIFNQLEIFYPKQQVWARRVSVPHRLADSGPSICRKLGIAFVFLGVIAICGCYHVRVIVPQPDPGTEYKKKTVQNLAWGALPKKKDVPTSNCLNSTGLDEVRVSSNLGYSFLTVGTL